MMITMLYSTVGASVLDTWSKARYARFSAIRGCVTARFDALISPNAKAGELRQRAHLISRWTAITSWSFAAGVASLSA
jgi:hypothetical protein